jgi:hypothetical protein
MDSPRLLPVTTAATEVAFEREALTGIEAAP